MHELMCKQNLKNLVYYNSLQTFLMMYRNKQHNTAILKQVDFEKMSRHRIQWLLACNLLSNFVCTLKNVAEGYIHEKNANMGGAVQSI